MIHPFVLVHLLDCHAVRPTHRYLYIFFYLFLHPFVRSVVYLIFFSSLLRSILSL